MLGGESTDSKLVNTEYSDYQERITSKQDLCAEVVTAETLKCSLGEVG